MSSRILQLMKNAKPKFNLDNVKNKTINFQLYFMIGAPAIGSMIGIREGYKLSKDYDILRNIGDSLTGGLSGFLVGTIIGLFWPVSIPVLAMRIYDRRRLDYSILEKNHITVKLE